MPRQRPYDGRNVYAISLITVTAVRFLCAYIEENLAKNGLELIQDIILVIPTLGRYQPCIDKWFVSKADKKQTSNTKLTGKLKSHFIVTI